MLRSIRRAADRLRYGSQGAVLLAPCDAEPVGHVLLSYLTDSFLGTAGRGG